MPTNDFERDGALFTLTDILANQSELTEEMTRTETVTLPASSSELSEALKLFDPTMDFTTEDSYAGTLTLVNGGAGPDYGDTVYPGDVNMPPDSGVVFPPAADVAPAVTMPALTPPKYYADGSMGKLSIPKLNVNIRVYEGESLASLKKGAGHFTFTSAWTGNVALAAHNRGTNAYFGQIHTLKAGDRITYTTPYGTRTYAVFFVGQIRETDFSRLGQTTDNIITLITCVRDVPAMRVCVQAREIGA
jgi:sortase A